ncbi:excinuclease ABC subunit UvrC [Coprothermobacteraceae bacterium]|nr:excinuclease ABC subunit UvrC [Coprothermobacteraceae bacterium]
MDLDLEAVPRAPGVYVFYSSTGQVIYVGKASDLRKRLADYRRSQPGQKEFLVYSSADRVDWIVLPGERQALEMEERLIKKYAPPFNVLLKDGKGYSYIRIDLNEDFPAIQVVRVRSRRTKAGSLYFGPFVPLRVPDLPGKSRGDLRNLAAIAEDVFGLRSCRGPLRKRERPCVYYEIGKCSAPCAGRISKADYRKRVELFISFLKGNTDEVEARLYEMMAEEAKNLNFERAKELRDMLYTVKRVGMDRAVEVDGSADILGFAARGDQGAGFVVSVRDGRITNVFGLKYAAADMVGLEELVEAFLRDYARTYHEKDVQVYTEEGLMKMFEQSVLPIELPLAAIPPSWKHLLAVATENAEGMLERNEKRERVRKGLVRIGELLRLPSIPFRIEGFDMAQMQGNERVGGKVAYVNGQFHTDWYRHYRIRGSYKDDLSFMKEVLIRRLQEQDIGLPDLMLIDGGRDHLAVALQAMETVGVRVPAVAMAKPDDRLFVCWQDEAIVLPPEDLGKQILQSIRDEAHRWVNSYHRKVREDFGDILLNVPGIGKNRRRKLLETFGGIIGLRSATVEELATKSGLPLRVAQQLYRVLHEGEEGP